MNMIEVNDQSSANQIPSYTSFRRIFRSYSSGFASFPSTQSITTILFYSSSYQSTNYTSIDTIYCDYKPVHTAILKPYTTMVRYADWMFSVGLVIAV